MDRTVTSPRLCSTSRTFVFYIIFLILAVHATPAIAGKESSIVVQVKGEQGEALAKRICNELRALGLDAHPSNIGADGHSERSAENMATSSGAAAGISVELSSGVVDVWVADRVTGKTVHRKAEIKASDQPVDTIVVVTAVELLRASLMEINGQKKQAGDVAPSKEIKKFAASKPREEKIPQTAPTNRFHVELGPSMSVPSFDMTPSLSLWTGIYIRAAKSLDVGIVGLVPILSSSTDIEEGKVKISPGLIGGELALPLQIARSRVGFRLGAGAGVALFNMRGLPEDGYIGYEALKTAAAFFGNAAIGVKLTERLTLRLDVLFTWTLVGQVLLAGQREVASIGHPWLAGALVLDMAVF